MPSLLALTDVSVVSLSAMRLTMVWSVAFDQLACQPAPRKCGSSAVVRKFVHLGGGDVGCGRRRLREAEMRQERGVEGGLGGRAGGRETVDRLDVGVDAGEEIFAIEAVFRIEVSASQRRVGAVPASPMARRRRKRWRSASRGNPAPPWTSGQARLRAVRRAETSALESTMPFRRSMSRAKLTACAVRAPSARPASATLPVATSFCAVTSSLCVRIIE